MDTNKSDPKQNWENFRRALWDAVYYLAEHPELHEQPQRAANQ